jgi:hypothetical protein
MCADCGDPTGRCEEDSLHSDDGAGPFCEPCYDEAQRLCAAIRYTSGQEAGE